MFCHCPSFLREHRFCVRNAQKRWKEEGDSKNDLTQMQAVNCFVGGRGWRVGNNEMLSLNTVNLRPSPTPPSRLPRPLSQYLPIFITLKFLDAFCYWSFRNENRLCIFYVRYGFQNFPESIFLHSSETLLKLCWKRTALFYSCNQIQTKTSSFHTKCSSTYSQMWDIKAKATKCEVPKHDDRRVFITILINQFGSSKNKISTLAF